MTIHDIKQGQTVFIQGERDDSKAVHEAVVRKVGRKYVTIGDHWGSRFTEHYDGRPYLIEHGGFGTKRRLYPSKAALDEDAAATELRQWLYNTCVSWTQLRHYTLEQLQAVKRILGGDEHGAD